MGIVKTIVATLKSEAVVNRRNHADVARERAVHGFDVFGKAVQDTARCVWSKNRVGERTTVCSIFVKSLFPATLPPMLETNIPKLPPASPPRRMPA